MATYQEVLEARDDQLAISINAIDKAKDFFDSAALETRKNTVQQYAKKFSLVTQPVAF